MTKVYILNDEDFKKLLEKMEKDPRHEQAGNLSEKERQDYEKAHRFYNYIIRRWIDEVKNNAN